MADNVKVTNPNPNTDYVVATEELSDNSQLQLFGINLSSTTKDQVTASNPLPVSINSNSVLATAFKQDIAQACLDLIKSELSPIKASYTENLLTINTTAPANTLSANLNRKGGFIQNISDVDMYINETGVSINSDCFMIYPGQIYNLKTTNAIKIICASGSNKKARLAQW